VIVDRDRNLVSFEPSLHSGFLDDDHVLSSALDTARCRMPPLT
jgi:hypothetical protein